MKQFSICLTEAEMRTLLAQPADYPIEFRRRLRHQPQTDTESYTNPAVGKTRHHRRWHARSKERPWKDGKPYFWHDPVGVFCPYGQAGDQLWVRETFRKGQYAVGRELEDLSPVGYRADFVGEPALKWTSSTCMPRWASRISLEVKQVRPLRNAAGIWEWSIICLRLPEKMESTHAG